MRIGIVINCYDKWDEAKLTIDMIRSWTKCEYRIGVCSNNPDFTKWHDYLEADYYILANDIPFKKQEGGEATVFDSQDDNYYIRLRAADSVQKACKYMTEQTDVEYVIHIHADAWFLDEDGVIKLIKRLQWRGKQIAVRGTGLDTIYKHWTSTSAFGQADDHFFVFNRAFADSIHLWDYDTAELMMRKYSVHGTLMTVFVVRAGLKNIWYYRLLKDCLDYRGDKTLDGEIKPSSYDPEYGFLHIHRGSLPKGWGKALQAWYMLNKTVDKPESWKLFIFTHYYGHEVLAKIKFENERLNKKMRLRLYSKKLMYKKRITYKVHLLNHFGLSTFLHNVKQRVFKWIASILFPHVDVAAMYRKLNKGLDSWVEEWDK